MMKGMLKKIAALLIAVMCLATVAVAETAAGADGDWTMNILADERLIAEYPCHASIDLNGDGVPVLIISTTENDFISVEDRAVVYVYAEGEPKAVPEVGGSGGDRFFANPDERALTHYSRLSGEKHIAVYRVGNGALEQVTKVDRYSPHHTPERDSGETLCFPAKGMRFERGISNKTIQPAPCAVIGRTFAV